MGSINMARVIIGGVVAGLVINASEFVLNEMVLKADMEKAVARMNLPPIGGPAIGTFVTLGFILGIVMVWLYAAIRPRLGAGASTAACAGATTWFFAYLYPTVGMWAMGMWPDVGPLTIALVWGLIELILAAVAGAWLYQEQGSSPAARL
jgi:hypothetical protein